jgi:hypothetical protein
MSKTIYGGLLAASVLISACSPDSPAPLASADAATGSESGTEPRTFQRITDMGDINSVEAVRAIQSPCVQHH